MVGYLRTARPKHRARGKKGEARRDHEVSRRHVGRIPRALRIMYIMTDLHSGQARGKGVEEPVWPSGKALSPFLTGRMFVRQTYFGHFDVL